MSNRISPTELGADGQHCLDELLLRFDTWPSEPRRSGTGVRTRSTVVRALVANSHWRSRATARGTLRGKTLRSMNYRFPFRRSPWR